MISKSTRLGADLFISLKYMSLKKQRDCTAQRPEISHLLGGNIRHFHQSLIDFDGVQEKDVECWNKSLSFCAIIPGICCRISLRAVQDCM